MIVSTAKRNATNKGVLLYFLKGANITASTEKSSMTERTCASIYVQLLPIALGLCSMSTINSRSIGKFRQETLFF